jgi:hypothetical protein
MRRPFTTHGQHWRSERGTVLPLVALSMVTLTGFMGLGLDVGAIYRHRRVMQTAADAGALAGASEVYRQQTGRVVTAARSATAANRFTHGSEDITVTVNRPPATGAYAGNARFVEVLISQPSPTYFMRVFGWNSVPVPARAVAGVGANNRNCIYVLDPTMSRSFRFENNGNLRAQCGVMVNSNDGVAMKGENSASVQATSVSVTGGYVLQGATSTPRPVTGVPPEPDPLGYLQPPTVAACTQTNYTASSGSRVLWPGVYCGGIRLSGNVQVTLNPGLYILRGGRFQLENTARIRGTGVTLFLTQGNVITVENTTTAELSAPTTGAYAGVLFYQDPNNGSTETLHIFENATNSYFEGALYFPTQILRLENVTNERAAYTVIVARSLQIENTGGLRVSANYSGLPGGSPLKRVTLVE